MQINVHHAGMKSLSMKLLLPDSVYNLIVERARTEGVEPAHYCSSLITESVENTIESKSKLAFGVPGSSSARHTNGLDSQLPDTVEQILSICRYVWHEKMEYADAVRKVASDLNVLDTTVRDKCTRRISLPHAPIDTARFLAMLTAPTELRDYLCHRFPKHAGEIVQRFEPIMPRDRQHFT